MLILLSSLVLAEGEACHADRPCETPEITEGRSNWDIIKSMPSNDLRVAFISSKIILPQFKVISIIAIIVGLLASLLLFFKKKKKSWKPILVIWILLGIGLGLLYSVAEYYDQGAEQGIIVCTSKTECSIAVHIHANLDVSVCGKEHVFPFEKGDLNKPHTHKEKNKIHYHALLKVDPVTKKILDPIDLTLKAFFDQMGERFNGTCLLDKCNGDRCSGDPTADAGVMMSVQNKNVANNEWLTNLEYENYVWKDGDKISIRFDHGGLLQ